MSSSDDGVLAELQLVFAAVTLADLEKADALEREGYPADEAASRERISFRLSTAGEHFKGLWSASNELVGFINGTRSASTTLTHCAMAGHDIEGKNLCIHSVVVSPKWQRRGLGQAMLARYLAAEREQASTTGVVQVTLICKENLQQFYRNAGFSLVGPSDVVHGEDPWYEYSLPL